MMDMVRNDTGVKCHKVKDSLFMQPSGNIAILTSLNQYTLTYGPY